MAGEAFRVRLLSRDNESVTLNLILFMKEKIFEKIKEALGKTSFSERTLQKKAELIAKKITDESEITDELIDDAVEELKTMEGQFNHELALKSKTKEPLEKTEKNVPQGHEEPSAESNQNDDPIRKIMERIESLEAERLREKKAMADESFYKSVVSKLKENGASNETILKAALYEAKIDYDKPVEDNVASIRKAYDIEAAKIPEVKPFFGGGGGQKNVAEREAERIARKEKILKEGRI